MYTYMYVCMYVRMYVCLYVYMCVCVCVYIYIYMYIGTSGSWKPCLLALLRREYGAATEAERLGGSRYSSTFFTRYTSTNADATSAKGGT